jgi:hypothetical protein
MAVVRGEVTHFVGAVVERFEALIWHVSVWLAPWTLLRRGPRAADRSIDGGVQGLTSIEKCTINRVREV